MLLLLYVGLALQGWMDRPRRLVVAVDGGVYLKYDNWRKFSGRVPQRSLW